MALSGAFSPRTLIITNGNQGSDAQAMGLELALGVQAQWKHVRLKAPYGWLAPWGPVPPGDVGDNGRVVSPPWPDLVISVGRHAAPYALAVKRAAKGRTFAVALQNPATSTTWWDLIWAPDHDRLEAPNVVTTLTSPHRLTKERLDAAARDLDLSDLPSPRITVLVGGLNSAFTFGADQARELCAKLDALNAGSFLITTSRRTPPEVQSVIAAWAKSRKARLWTGDGPNPYLGFLGAADAVVVTADSVNMAGEAASTGKPVYVLDLPGDAPKFRRFHAALAATGATRPLAGPFVPWTYAAIDPNREIAEAVRTSYLAWAAKDGAGR